MPAPSIAWLCAVSDVVLIGGFLAAITLPVMDVAFTLDPAPILTENRTLPPAPHITSDAGHGIPFTRVFEPWWNDRFGFRRSLVAGHHLLKLSLGLSPVSSVRLGLDGWLFFADGELPAAHQLPPPFSAEELAAWEHEILARQRWLADRGIHFLLVIAPNKAWIYGEFLAGAGSRGRPAGRLDQLLERLAQHPDIDVVDPREALRRAKVAGAVYSRTDTHWTDRGAWIVSREIVTRLAVRFPEVSPIPWSAIDPARDGGWSGDLARMLSLTWHLQEPREILRFRDPPTARPVDSTLFAKEPGQRITVTEKSGSGLPRVVMFHDSFGIALEPFLSESFGRIVYSAGPREGLGNFDESLVKAERCKVVIQEIAGRFLVTPFRASRQTP